MNLIVIISLIAISTSITAAALYASALIVFALIMIYAFIGFIVLCIYVTDDMEKADRARQRKIYAAKAFITGLKLGTDFGETQAVLQFLNDEFKFDDILAFKQYVSNGQRVCEFEVFEKSYHNPDRLRSGYKFTLQETEGKLYARHVEWPLSFKPVASSPTTSVLSTEAIEVKKQL